MSLATAMKYYSVILLSVKCKIINAVLKGCALTNYDCVCVSMWKHAVTCIYILKPNFEIFK